MMDEDEMVSRIKKAVGEMQSFPGCEDMNDECTEFFPVTLNRYMSGTHLEHDWPDLLERAARAAAGAIMSALAEPPKV